MPFERFVSLLNQFPGAKELHLQGLGEPMMHPEFFDMIEYAVLKGLRVSTSSNLTLLSDRRAHRCISSGLSVLHVSAEAGNAELYESIRVGSSFRRFERNVHRLVTAKKSAGSSTPILKLTCVAMKSNVSALPALIEQCAEWGLEEVFVQHLCHDYGEISLPDRYREMRRFVDNESLLNAESRLWQRHFDAARSKAEELGLALRLPQIVPKTHAPDTPGQERCSWPWRGAYISYQGYLMPCCMISTPDRLNFGNTHLQGVAAVWNGDASTAFRSALSSSNPPAVCRSCAVYKGVF